MATFQPSPLRQMIAALCLGTAALGAHAAPDFADRVSERASELVVGAMNFIGVPYRRGGSGEGGFDCSGFTRHVFENTVGLVLPRRVDEQATAPGLVQIRRDELQPGDLVFFNTLKRTFSHVGIYIGEGRFIHSPRTGGQVRIEDMGHSYWTKRFTGARRALTAAVMPSAAAAAAPAVAAATPVAASAEPAASPAAANAAEAARLAY
jgi:hypothetical protein